MTKSGQTYATHIRWLPPFHFFALPVLLGNFLWTLWIAATSPSRGSVWACLVALAILMTIFFARVMALSAQDRIIRLEQQLRMRDVLPADLKGHIGELTREQFVGLRFASDAELPDLMRRVLSGELKSTTEIKKAVKAWQGDYLRV